MAPFDVRLPSRGEADELIETVVQPDLSVVCDQSKLDEKGCRGAPDWVIEDLSPETAVMDLNTKARIHEQHCVRESWFVQPVDRWVMVYALDGQGQYGRPRVFGTDEPVAPQGFPDLAIDWCFMAKL